MTAKTNEIPVRLDELAGHLGNQDAEHWIRQVGGPIERDWLGRSVTTPAAARKALDAFSDQAAESARLASEFDAWLKDWERCYIAVGEAAYQDAAKRRLKAEQQALRDSDDTFYLGLPQTVSPQGRAVAQKVCDEAREAFEKQNPRLTFKEWTQKRGRKR